MVSAKCELRLGDGVKCDDARKKISWVLCRTWQLVNSPEVKGDRSKAMTLAHAEARAKCQIDVARKEAHKVE